MSIPNQPYSKTNIINFLKDEQLEIAISIIGSLISYSSILTTPDIPNLIRLTCGSLTATTGIKELIKDYIKFKLNQFEETLKNDDEIAEHKELYFTYINNLKSLLQSLSVQTPLEICHFYNFLLNKGYLSINRKYIYKTYKYALEKHVPLGSIIITGTSCCRHNASFLTDLLNSMDIQALNIPTHSPQINQPISTYINWLLNIPPKDKHLVTGIIDKDGKYMYDPTFKFKVASFNEEKAKEYKHPITNIAFTESTLSTEPDLIYKIITQEPIQNALNPNNPTTLELFKNAPIKKVDPQEIFALKQNIDRMFQTPYTNDKLNDFYEEQLPLLERINYLQKKLTFRYYSQSK